MAANGGDEIIVNSVTAALPTMRYVVWRYPIILMLCYPMISCYVLEVLMGNALTVNDDGFSLVNFAAKVMQKIGRAVKYLLSSG